MMNDGADGNSMTFKNTSFYVEAKGDQPQWFLYLMGTGNVFNFENVFVKGVHTNWASPVVAASDEASANNTYTFNENCAIDWSEE